jgi:hypothetical protein
MRDEDHRPGTAARLREGVNDLFPFCLLKHAVTDPAWVLETPCGAACCGRVR